MSISQLLPRLLVAGLLLTDLPRAGLGVLGTLGAATPVAPAAEASTAPPPALPPLAVVLRAVPGKRDWPSAPVLCPAELLGEDIDPDSLRVFADPEKCEVPVPFRLRTEGSPPRLVEVAWVKEGRGTQTYAVRFDRRGGGVYELPHSVPRVGCGEPLAFGSRSQPGLLTSGYNSTFAAADLDRDGDLDLFGAQPGDPALATLAGLYYYENLGGVLAAPRRILRRAIAPAFLDWDGDGRPDLLGGGLLLLTRFKDGEIVFAPPRKIDGLETGAWQFCDWDGDGLEDLLVGRGDASGYRPPALSHDPATTPPYTAGGVWKGGSVRGEVLFQKNIGERGAPRFAAPVRLEAGGKPLSVHGRAHPAAADWDGDGDLDLLCGSTFDLYYFENTGGRREPRLGTGRLVAADASRALGAVYLRPAAGDWDGDGDPDVLLAQESGFVALLENGAAEASPGPRLVLSGLLQGRAPLLDAGSLAVIAPCDWNGDGVLDLVSGNSYGEVLLFLADGAQRFREAQPLGAADRPLRVQAGPSGSIQGPEEARWGYTNPEVCDWDGDGLLDLVLADIRGRHTWYRNVGSRTAPVLEPAGPLRVDWGGKPPPKPAWVWEEPGPSELLTVWRTKPECLDWNQDDLMDLVTLDHEGYLALFRRRRDAAGATVLTPGERIFRDRNGAPLHFGEGVAGRAGRGKFDLVDWDQDGDRDLLAYEFDTLKSVGYFRNEGNDAAPVLVYQGDLLTPRGAVLAGHSTTPCAVDLDRDGLLDLLVGCEDGLIYYFHRAFIEADLPALQVVRG
ncbi:MAG: VCBS repeat-containing protein [Planctomycetes bacterium]|nr:VCBS repeat-containing protein [Planctomycetota bacterium]